jgi:hypothetical protein
VISSFCAVATKEIKEEAAVMVASIRRIYPFTPILLSCDDDTAEFIAKFSFANVNFDVSCEPEGLKIAEMELSIIARHNEFHRVDCIAMKMHCLEKALAEYGDTMFLDADMIFLQPIHEGIKGDLTLSPHYGLATEKRKYGAFNAGYLWTNQASLPSVWREIYKTRSKFYEQQGMIWLLEEFNVGLFDETHNVGCWRFPIRQLKEGYNWVRRLDFNWDWSTTKSIHGHVTETFKNTASMGLAELYMDWRRIILDGIKEQAPEIRKFIDGL